MSNARRYYAVRIGREGPRIYDSYAEFRAATLGLSGSSGKGFDNIRDAQEWLSGYHFSGGVTTTHTRTDISVSLNISGGTNGPRAEASTSSSTSTTTTTTTSPATGERRWTNQGSAQYDSPLRNHHSPHRDLHKRLNDIRAGLSSQQQNNRDVPPPAPVPEPTIELSEEQKDVLKMVRAGRNIFFTGPAGTGKSVLLRAIIKYLRCVHGPYGGVAVTAPTGIAGLNIGGQTIHSWSGIRLGKEPFETLKGNLAGSARKNWNDAHALIIDEISMLDGRLFDKLEAIGRYVRNDNRPFGGLQLILSGDFFQLPPVPDQDSTSTIASTFAFQAKSWSRCVDHRTTLTKVFRQKDNKFIEMLSSMRTGVLEDWHIEEFKKLCRPIHYNDGIMPTQLFPLKAQVEFCNLDQLNALPGKTIVYKAMDSRGYDIYGDRLSPRAAEQLLDKLVCPKEVPLKVGAQSSLQNIVQGWLVNGSLGKVEEFISTHEAQGRHIEIAELERAGKEGQLRAVVYPPEEAENHRGGLVALDHHTFTPKQLWPLVKFTNGKVLLCSPVEFTVEGLKGNLEARRVQIPIALAWAMSIHKSQGQTLTRVKVDLARIFEKGQAYVALSRATSMDGLEINNFTPEKVMAHPDVLEWQAQWEKERHTLEEMDSDQAISQWHDSF
ncbi:hypothetical protein HYDPIDRAFT_25060 [Hydnomerulius pinastri MD-312]|nr:hypothetical protein HYDPIDRAFT_25060 [Hydnomerulius pinastri MD-312]